MCIVTSVPRCRAKLHRSGTNRGGLDPAAPMELEVPGVAGAATHMPLLRSWRHLHAAAGDACKVQVLRRFRTESVPLMTVRE